MVPFFRKAINRFLRTVSGAQRWLRTRRHRDDSSPFLSSDYWLQFADLVINDRDSQDEVVAVLKTRANPILFFETSLVSSYVDLLLNSESPFSLITTCNDDVCVPFQFMPPEDPVLEKRMRKLLESPLLARWFAKNPGLVHEKLIPLPLGPKWQWASQEFFGENKADHWFYYNKFGRTALERFEDKQGLKSGWLYFNFGDTTAHAYFRAHTGMRQRVKELLHTRFPWAPNEEFGSYFKTLSRYKFCLSPPGQGLDTHRTWEALMVGTIPILITSPLDVLYHDLPVVIVDDWDQITEPFLAEAYQRLKSRTWSFEVCYAPYWEARFAEAKKGIPERTDGVL